MDDNVKYPKVYIDSAPEEVLNNISKISPKYAFIQSNKTSEIDLDNIKIMDSNRLKVKKAQIDYYKKHKKIHHLNKYSFVQSTIDYIDIINFNQLMQLLPHLTNDQIIDILNKNYDLHKIPVKNQKDWYKWVIKKISVDSKNK